MAEQFIAPTQSPSAPPTSRNHTSFKTRRVRSAAAVGVLALALTACGGEADENSFEITVAHHDSTNGPRSAAIEAFVDEVNSRDTGYTLDMVHRPDAALCDPNEQMICASDGRADITQVLPGYHPAEFPLSTVVELGFIEVSDATGQALMDLYDSSDEVKAEWEAQNVRPLFPANVAEYVVGVAEPIESVEDLSGRTLRAVGYSGTVLSEYGVETIPTPAPEIYESLERGVIDGFAIPLDYALLQSYHEVAPHFYDIGLGNDLGDIWAINQDTWGSFPTELQDAMLEVGADVFATSWNDYVVPSVEELCSTGATDIETVESLIDPEFVANGLETAKAEWIAGAGASVDDPEAWVENYLDIVAEHADAMAGERPPLTEVCQSVL